MLKTTPQLHTHMKSMQANIYIHIGISLIANKDKELSELFVVSI